MPVHSLPRKHLFLPLWQGLIVLLVYSCASGEIALARVHSGNDPKTAAIQYRLELRHVEDRLSSLRGDFGRALSDFACDSDPPAVVLLIDEDFLLRGYKVQLDGVRQMHGAFLERFGPAHPNMAQLSRQVSRAEQRVQDTETDVRERIRKVVVAQYIQSIAFEERQRDEVIRLAEACERQAVLEHEGP